MATLSDPPAPGQIVQHEGREYETVKEGLAYILYPRSVKDPKKPGSDGKPQSVFYNPVEAGQVLGNRYVVILKLGHGASSTVWLARDRKKYVPMSMEVAWDAASADKAC